MWVLSNSIPAVKIVKTWHLQPSTQTLSSQMAVRLSGKVASSSKQSESEEQPHLCDSSPLPSLSPSSEPLVPSREEPLESEAPAPHIGRSIGQLASEWQPVCMKMGIWHDITLPTVVKKTKTCPAVRTIAPVAVGMIDVTHLPRRTCPYKDVLIAGKDLKDDFR